MSPQGDNRSILRGTYAERLLATETTKTGTALLELITTLYRGILYAPTHAWWRSTIVCNGANIFNWVCQRMREQYE